MMNPANQMPEEERRRHQAEIGLVIVTRRDPQPPTEKKKKMEQSQRQSVHGNTSRAQQALEHLSEPLTFKEVAMHELKRAAVYVPILFSAGVGLAWTCKKLIFKVV
jgi:hypothetical protein